jgi:DUF4097 and DUF4098 domain-containing protein YvlB
LNFFGGDIMNARIATSCIALSAMFVAMSAAHAGTMIDETRPVNTDALISVELVNGHLKVEGWDRQEFHVSGELSDDAEGFELTERGNGLHFEETLNRGRRCSRGEDCRDNSKNANLTIAIPRNGVLRLQGTNLDVDVSGLERNTEVELVNGKIEARNLKGAINLSTVNGAINANALDGRVSLQTVNGHISDQDSTGSLIEYHTVNGGIESNTKGPRVRLENVNGKIDLRLGNIDELEASTVGGNLAITTALNPEASLHLSSVQGGIALALPAATSANFAVRTSVGGRIDNALSSDQPLRRDRFVNSSDLDFVLNGGGAEVKISTVSGSIKLCAASADPVPGC